jgi:hypothetical protein
MMDDAAAFWDHASPKIFGTPENMKLRWRCRCGQANVTQLRAPLSLIEPCACRRCHRINLFEIQPAKPASSHVIPDGARLDEGQPDTTI